MLNGSNQESFLLDALTPRERDILQLIAEDLSNAEIAERLVLSASTIKWYVKQIYSKLDVHTRDEAIARAADLNLAPQSVLSTPTNLPAPTTSLVGRAGEIDAVRRRLLRDDVRLLTLVGLPGIGKTRLSLETAATLLRDFPDGVYFVPLAPLSNPALVAHAICGIVGIQETGGLSITDSLKQYLREKRLLLVLDNFEHLMPAVPLVADLLATAPKLKVLVTSREVLHVYGEQEYPVPPLTQPDANYNGDIQALSESEAVALLVKRVQAVKPDFELTPENASAIAEICIHLEGLPLALELAAARVKLYSPQALLGRLNQRLNTLTGGARDLPERQQTLRGAIAWSYDLLNESEKKLFNRLGVFVWGWSLEAMEAVCAGTHPLEDGTCAVPLQIDVYDGLESLLNKSLVQQTESATDEPRFMMLETLREYALEKLSESGEEEVIRRAHASYFLTLGEQAETGLHGDQFRQWLNLCQTEIDNLRTAMEWYHDHDVARELRLLIVLRNFWTTRGYALEVGERIERLIAKRSVVSTLPSSLWVRTLHLAAHLACVRGDDQAVQRWGNEALDTSSKLEDVDHVLLALRRLGQAAAMRGDDEEAESILLEALGIAREHEDDRSICHLLNMLGTLVRGYGDYDRALLYHTEALRLIAQVNDRSYLLRVKILWETGTSWLFNQDYEQAQRCYKESLSLSREPIDVAYFLEGFGGLAGVQKQPQRAARLLGAADAIREIAQTPRVKPDRYYEHFLAVTREALDETSFVAAWEEGRAMTSEQAIAYALDEETA